MSSAINLLLNLIIAKHLQNSRCLLILNNQRDLTLKGIPFTIYNFNKISELNLEKMNRSETERCEDVLLITENPVELFESYEEYLLKNTRVRFNNRRYIILLKDGFNEGLFATEALNFVGDILLVKCSREVVGFTSNAFLIGADYSYCDLYTHYYVGDGNGVNKLYLLERFNFREGRFEKGNDLFPDKLSDQQGRVFRIGAADYVPYCFMETKRGSELSFAFEFSRRLNMTPVVVSSLEETWGDIYRNWTGVGILGKLVMDEHDISLGALFSLPYRVLFSDFSQVTAYSRVTCLVPKPKLVEGWLMPVTLFSVNIWLAFGICYSAIIGLDYLSKLFRFSGSLLHRHEQALHGTIFNVYTTFMLQGQPEFVVPKETSRRIVHLLNLILSLIFGVLYSTRLSSTMIVPTYENDINTAKQLADSTINWGELWIDWVLPLQIDDTNVAVKLSEKFIQDTESNLRDYSLKNNFAFGMERLPSGFFAIGDYIKDDIIQNYKIMKEDLYCQYASLQVRKNSILLPLLNKYILLSAQSGLFSYWESEASIHHSNMNIQMGIIYPYTEPAFISLRFAHVKGSFGILFIGHAVSFLVFVCERLHLTQFIL